MLAWRTSVSPWAGGASGPRDVSISGSFRRPALSHVLRVAGVMAVIQTPPPERPPPERPTSDLSLWNVIKGHMAWVVSKMLGFVVCLPLAVELAIKTLLSPRKAFKSVGWTEALHRDPLPGLKHEWVDVDGTKLHIVRTGDSGDSKPVLLLVHGFPEEWFSWRRQMEEFRGEWSVVAMDLRGYGGSDKPKGVSSYSVDKLVGDVVGVIRHVAGPQQKVALCTHDFGGMVGWHVAALHPELVDRLVVMACPHPACFKMDWEQMKKSWYIFAFQMPWVPEAMMTWGGCQMVGDLFAGPESGCRNPGALTAEDVERYKQEFGAPGVATAAINYYRAWGDYGTKAKIPEYARAVRRKLEMPVLLLWADHDIALGTKLINGTEKYVEQLEVHVLQDSSHWIQQDRWQEVNRLLRSFLTKKVET